MFSTKNVKNRRATINIEKNGEKDIDTFVNVQHVPVYRIMTAE